jgi:hypothetical protein
LHGALCMETQRGNGQQYESKKFLHVVLGI